MSSHLKRLGMSDTKFQLKYHTPKCSSIRLANDCSSSMLKTQGKRPISSSNLPKVPRAAEGRELVLNALVELISKRQRETCSFADHDRNPIKFICLEESCPAKMGCSYCFLEHHQHHNKVESKACVKDLLELKQKVEINRELLGAELLIKKEELLLRIDREVELIREEFAASLEYMNSKVKEAITAKISESVELLMATEDLPRQRYSSAIKEAIDAPLQESEGNDWICSEEENIISKFMETSLKAEPKAPSYLKASGANRKSQASHPALSREDEQEMLGKLSRLNLTQVEQYLKHESAQTKQFLNGFKIYEEYYTELSSSLSEFFAAFKRALPRLKAFETGLISPQILKSCPVRRG